MSRTSLLKTLWGQNRGLNVLLLVLIILTMGTFLLQTQFFERQLSDLRSEVRDQQQSLRKLQFQKRSGSMPVSALAQVESELAQFEKLVPPSEKFSEFVGELFRHASQAKLNIKQISYNPEWDDDLGLLSYGLKFSISGQYSQLKRFIHLLESAERIFIISDISMSGGKVQKEKSAKVTLQIVLKTFFRGDEQ